MPNTYSVTGEANWVGFNRARDFDLYPQPELAPLNNFGYPYAEVGGDPLNSFDPKEFKYDYVSKSSNKSFGLDCHRTKCCGGINIVLYCAFNLFSIWRVIHMVDWLG